MNTRDNYVNCLYAYLHLQQIEFANEAKIWYAFKFVEKCVESKADMGDAQTSYFNSPTENIDLEEIFYTNLDNACQTVLVSEPNFGSEFKSDSEPKVRRGRKPKKSKKHNKTSATKNTKKRKAER